jgi:hypothetical protein
MRVASTDGMESTIMEKDEQNCVWKAPWRMMSRIVFGNDQMIK